MQAYLVTMTTVAVMHISNRDDMFQKHAIIFPESIFRCATSGKTIEVVTYLDVIVHSVFRCNKELFLSLAVFIFFLVKSYEVGEQYFFCNIVWEDLEKATPELKSSDVFVSERVIHSAEGHLLVSLILQTL